MTSQPANVEAFKQFERDGYTRVAEDYDRVAAPVTAQLNEALLDVVGVGHGIRLLDVACGPGWLTAAAVARGAVATGIDFATQMVNLARRRCPQVDFRVGDAEDLPFDDAQFDAVVCNLGFPHFPDPERAMREAFRVLKHGRDYAFTNWTPPARNPFMALILGSIQAHGSLAVDLPPGPSLFRFGEPQACEDALTASGFESVSLREVPFHWSFPSAEAVVPAVISSTARLGPMLAAQSAQQRARVEEAIVQGAHAYTSGGSIAIPTSVLLACARKP